MKRVLTLLLICCAPFVFGEDEPVFEEVEEQPATSLSIPFAAEEPVFEEDDEKKQVNACTCEDEECDHEHEETYNPLRAERAPPKARYRAHKVTYVDWRRYKAHFGFENILIRFPQKPAISQSSTFLTAYAYDNAVLYSLVGYYPPLCNIDPLAHFDAILYSVDHYPYTLVSHVIFQVPNGDWVMDYVAHDYIQNLILKARTIVTPFNSYTLQCAKPNGMRDYFDYFLDNFLLKCDCP